MDDIWSTLRGAMAAAAKTYADADGSSVNRPHIMAAHGLLSNALRQEYDAAMARGYIEAEDPAEPVASVTAASDAEVEASAVVESAADAGTAATIADTVPTSGVAEDATVAPATETQETVA